VLKEFAYGLKTFTKNGKSILVAAMRKLIHIIFALLKKQLLLPPTPEMLKLLHFLKVILF